MGKRVYIHIGAHKCASSTIQANIRRNKEYFESRLGISYLMGEELARTDFAKHFRRISRSEIKKGENGFSDSVESARACVENLIRHAETENVFISWEGILGHCSLDIYGGIYTHSSLVSESLREILQGYECRYLMLVREQASFIESCYLQQIKEGRSVSFDDFIDKVGTDKIYWKPVIESLSSNIDGEFLVVPFEAIRVLGTRGFLENTLSYLFGQTVNLEGLDIFEKSNGSMSNYGVEVAREIFPHLSDKNRSAMRKIIYKEFNSSRFGKAVFFNGFTRRLVGDLTREDNLRLFDKYLVNFIGFSALPVCSFREVWGGSTRQGSEDDGSGRDAPELSNDTQRSGADEIPKGLLHMANWSFWRRKKHHSKPSGRDSKK